MNLYRILKRYRYIMIHWYLMNSPGTRHFRAAGTAAIYAVAIISLLGLWLAPEAATRLGVEDGPAENATAFLFVVASFAMAINGVRLLLNKSHGKLLPALLLCISVLFFIFAGEEISWGQRILGLETGEFMQQHNWQGEVNIHNLHTDIFNIGFHYGALFFLIVFPLYRAQTVQLLKKLRLGTSRHLIPPAWLAVPSFVFLGMLDPRFVYSIEKPWVALLYITALMIGLALLIHELVNAARSRNMVALVLLSASLALIGLGLFVSYLQAVDPEPNTISEYKELFIAAGLAIYALSWKRPAAEETLK